MFQGTRSAIRVETAALRTARGNFELLKCRSRKVEKANYRDNALIFEDVSRRKHPLTVNSEGVRAYALDPKTAEALWKKSEELVREHF